MARGSNTTIIHGTLEWNDFIGELQHREGLTSLHRNHYVARYILTREKALFIQLFAEDRYKIELEKLSISKYQLNKKAQEKKERELKTREEQAALKKKELEIEEIKAKAYQNQTYVAIERREAERQERIQDLKADIKLIKEQIRLSDGKLKKLNEESLSKAEKELEQLTKETLGTEQKA